MKLRHRRKRQRLTDAEEAKKTESKAKGSFDLADGIYKGTGTGYAGEVTVVGNVSKINKLRQLIS